MTAVTPPAQIVDGNGAVIPGEAWDATNHQFSLPQTAAATSDSSSGINYAPLLIQQSAATTGGYTYTNITTTTTTLVKTGAGTLHSVTINKPGASGTIELDDAVTHTSPVIGTITLPSTAGNGFTVTYDIAFSTGLSVTTGTAASDVTIAWK